MLHATHQRHSSLFWANISCHTSATHRIVTFPRKFRAATKPLITKELTQCRPLDYHDFEYDLCALKCWDRDKASAFFYRWHFATLTFDSMPTDFFYYILSNFIVQHWHDTDSYNPSSCMTRTYLFCIVNIVGTDVLARQGARESATMILTVLSRIDSVPARYDFW